MLIAQDPNSTIEALKAIPDLVWGGIIGVLGIIIGTLLSWIPVYFQLRHDSKESSISLLRDTYLSAAEKFSQVIGYIQEYYTTKENPTDGYNEAVSKLCILGTNETIKVVNTFNDYVIKALFELNPLKDRIHYLDLETKGLNNLMEEMIQRTKKALQDMEEYNLRGVHEPTKWDIFQDNFNFAQKQHSELSNGYEESSNEILKLTYELALHCQRKARFSEELLIPIITAIRKELSIPFDEQAYREMMAVSNKKWKENLQEYIVSKKQVYDEVLRKQNRQNTTTNEDQTK